MGEQPRAILKIRNIVQVAPPQLNVIPYTNNMKNSVKDNAKVRVAVEADAVRICTVLIRSIREICAPDYDNNEEILSDWCSNKTEEIMTQWINNPKNFFIVTETEDDGIVGTALYRRPESTVNMCFLVPEALHKGLGSFMLATMEEEARRLKHSEITLNSSITANKFYQRNGYKPNGEPVYFGKVIGFPLRKVIAV